MVGGQTKQKKKEKMKKKKQDLGLVSYGLAGGIELIKGRAIPCWTGPGSPKAQLGFAWRLTPSWRPEKAPHVRIASLPAYHGATTSPISPPRSILSPEQQPASQILGTGKSTLSLSLKFSPHLLYCFLSHSTTQVSVKCYCVNIFGNCQIGHFT